MPSKLFIAPEEADEVFSKVLTGLRFTDEEIVDNAALGTRNWLFFARRCGLTEFPERLLDELLHIAVLRRQPGLLSVVRVLAWVIEKMPEVLNEIRIETLTTVLKFLKTEAFSTGFDLNSNGQEKSISEHEQSEFQHSCRRLAVVLNQIYGSCNNPLSDEVDFWLKEV